MPERIRLSRARGWRKPDSAVVVSRPSRFGNLFRIGAPDPDTGHPMTRKDTVDRFTAWFDDPHPAEHQDEHRRIHAGLDSLRGRDLACWCPLGDGRTASCHADVLLERANRR